MKKRGKRTVKSLKNNFSYSKIILISIIFGILMIFLMFLYDKYFYLLPIGFVRFFVSNLTTLIPLVIMTLFGFLFNITGGGISDFMFYLISFVIHFCISFLFFFLYSKIKPSKRKRYLWILLFIFIFYLVSSMIVKLWGLYR